MYEAEVGDDVFGDDPTVNRLQELAAEMTGKAAAIYVPSGTQSNLLALMAHCGRGDEYVVGANAHTFRYEAGGAAVLGSIQPQTVPVLADGMVDLEAVDGVVKPDDAHFARTRLLCLENTNNGVAFGPERTADARVVADRHGLGVHLDGARLFNAAVRLDVSAAALAGPVDTVSVCLSKGLGAPVGSVLCGSVELIARAHRHRKILGGGMRQAGIIAAAGIVALTDHVDRLADDHANAALLAEALDTLDWLDVQPPCTNMVFATMTKGDPQRLVQHLDSAGVRILAGPKLRLVTHMDVTHDDIATVGRAFASLGG